MYPVWAREVLEAFGLRIPPLLEQKVGGSRRRIDPNLLDLRIVQIWLQWSQSADSIGNLPDSSLHIGQHGENTARGTVRVVHSSLLHKLGEPFRFRHRVYAAPTDEFPYLALEQGGPVRSRRALLPDGHARIPGFGSSHLAHSRSLNRSGHGPPLSSYW